MGIGMKTTLATATLVATTLLSTGAMALTKKVNLDLNSSHMRGQSRIPLTKMIQQETAGPRQGWKIVKVSLSAKSKHGAAEATLKVGRTESLSKIIAGTPEAFESDYSGFSTITLNAPNSYRGARSNRAKILIQGNVKVDSAKVVMKKEVKYDYTNDADSSYQKVGQFKADKVIGSSKTYPVHGYLDAIKLSAVKGKVSVNKVTVVFRNGDKVILDELNGKLKAGRSAKVFALKNGLSRPVKKVIVSAVSTKVFGSRGVIAVELSK
jgi:hypothetical protein